MGNWRNCVENWPYSLPLLTAELYYHYYLRTSETNYLNEAYIFYEAIRDRQYFAEVLDANNPPLFVKKLRYYARFIVVCLLLNKSGFIQELTKELSELVDQYITVFIPNDAAEWNVVLSEITTFIEAEKKSSPVDSSGNLFSFPGRSPIRPGKSILQEAILVGNYQNQIKFSELTLDVYRMLQILEREPAKEEDAATKRCNPHKYLLYKPSFSLLMHYISNAYKDMAESSALLLYISADGVKNNYKSPSGGYNGGVALVASSSRKNQAAEPVSDQSAIVSCLHPQDLLPFTRKPLFVVVDSNNSTAFKELHSLFGKPLLCLMSPTETTVKDYSQIGSLFTMFLHCPLKAILLMTDRSQLDQEAFDSLKTKVETAEKQVEELLESKVADMPDVDKFWSDDFLRMILVRHVLFIGVQKKLGVEKLACSTSTELDQLAEGLSAVDTLLQS